MIAVSVLLRVGIKVIADFTGVAQFRNAGEIGGAAWTFSQVTALGTSLVATYIYLNSDELAADGQVLSESFVWTIVGTLSSLWVFSFAGYMLLMKSRFRSTFFSLQTGYAAVQSRFVDGQTDPTKAWLLGRNKKQWLSIRDDVKAWTLENWERWEDESPAWFDDNFQASVDDDMIPVESLRRMNGGGESVRRRSSLGDVFGSGGGVLGPAQVAPIGGGGGGAEA